MNIKTNNLNHSVGRHSVLFTNKITFLIVFVLTYLFSSALRAELTQSIDRTNIHAGETFVLTLQINEETDEQPDLSLIPKEFTLLSNSQYQQSSYVNGRGSTIKGWKIKLSTLKTGNITIPAISVGHLKSTPIKLFIKDTSDRVTLGGKKKAIFLESEVDSESIYVQQQLIYTVRLFRAVNTHYARLSEPFAGDSIIEKLGEDVQYNKTIDNTRYLVTERRYAIFPQNSGNLKIDSINFTADVNDPNQKNRNRFLNTTRPISVNSKEKMITVKPQPAKASNPWIPASSVVLADKWTTQTQELTVGEPITWTILLTAQGLSEAQLPPIELPKITGLQWYPDTPQKERQINENGLLAQRIEKLAVIPSKEGMLTIPEIKVSWWDVKTDSQKIASIPARTFNVKPSLKDVSTANEPPTMIGPVNSTQIPANNTNISFWKNMSTGLFILWLFTLVAYFLKNGTTQNSKTANKNKLSKETPISLSEKASLSLLNKSIKSNSANDIEKNLIAWINAILINTKPVSASSNKTVFSIGDLLKSIPDLTLKQKLNNIEQQRYARKDNADSDYQCALNKDDLNLIRSSFINLVDKSTSNKIPSLYPS